MSSTRKTHIAPAYSWLPVAVDTGVAVAMAVRPVAVATGVDMAADAEAVQYIEPAAAAEGAECTGPAEAAEDAEAAGAAVSGSVASGSAKFPSRARVPTELRLRVLVLDAVPPLGPLCVWLARDSNKKPGQLGD